MKKYNGTTWVDTTLRQYKTATDTLTTLPADVYADGNNATVGISGNTVQNGTPTPSNPVEVQGVGVRTENFCIQFEHGGIQQSNGYLFDSDYRLRSNDFIQLAAGTYTISGTYNFAVRVYDTSKNYIAEQSSSVWSRDNLSFTISDGFIKIVVTNYDTNTYIPLDIQVMLNSGSTALPYEPYGYKIPNSNGQQTTNIYLGETQTTRRIKKLVLTGEEGWAINQSGTDKAYFSMPTGLRVKSSTQQICTHFVWGDVSSSSTTKGIYMTQSGVVRVRENEPSASDLTSFESFLQQQYANGTPVTVWYVLAEPTTGIVNEPIRKIGDYADSISGITIPTITGKDTFDVLTTLKPSEVELTYTGWHDSSVKEWDGSEWNK